MRLSSRFNDEPAVKLLAAQFVLASQLRIAKLYLKSNPDKARDYLQQVVDLVPDSALAREASELLNADFRRPKSTNFFSRSSRFSPGFSSGWRGFC